MSQVVAVFADPTWVDQAKLRLWAKTRTEGTVVLLTDDVTDANTVLARQLRCSGIVCMVARTPGTMRSEEEMRKSRAVRDRAMLELATEVVRFDVSVSE